MGKELLFTLLPFATCDGKPQRHLGCKSTCVSPMNTGKMLTVHSKCLVKNGKGGDIFHLRSFQGPLVHLNANCSVGGL